MRSQAEIIERLLRNHGKNPSNKKYEYRQGAPLVSDGIVAAFYKTEAQNLLTLVAVSRQYNSSNGVWLMVDESYQPSDGDARAIAETIAARNDYGNLANLLETEPLAVGGGAEGIMEAAKATLTITLSHIVAHMYSYRK